MDFWDLAKLMWRRWYVTVPMLAVTAVGALYIAITVGPEYQATGHVSVVFPTTERQAEAGETTRVNPFDEVTLVEAARIRLEGKQLEDELKAEGFNGEYAVEIDGQGRTLRVEVVAPTDEEALAAVHKLQDVAEEEVAFRQDEYDVAEGDRFNTVVYDQGESVETTASSMRRALVAVVGAGLILTVATVALVDAVARWRARSREPRPSMGTPAIAAAPAPAIAGSSSSMGTAAPTSGIPSVPSGPPAAARPTSGPPVAGSAAVPVRPRYTYSTAARASVSVPPATDANGTSGSPVDDELPVAGKSPGSSGRGGESEQGDRPRDDSTVVIPLSSAGWPGRTNGERPNGSGAGKS